MSPEEEINWGYSAYRYGELLGTGPVPIPEELAQEATEIRWIADQPEVDPV